MRFPRPALIVLFSLSLSLGVAAQQAPQRDPQAVSLIYVSSTSMGGLAVKDIQAEYKVRIYRSDSFVEYAAVLKALGRERWRIEAQASEGTSVSVTNGLWMTTRTPSGHIEKYPSASVSEVGIWLLPFLTNVMEPSDPQLELEYRGFDPASAVHQIRGRRFPNDAALRAIVKPCDVYLDAITSLPVKLVFVAHPPSNLSADISVEVRYAEYRSLFGLLVPTRVSYYVEGKLAGEYFLISLSPNTGLNETEFELR